MQSAQSCEGLYFSIKISAHYPQVISARLRRLQLSLAAVGRDSAPLVVSATQG